MSDPAFPRLPEEFHIKLPNGTQQVSYQDVNGRFWIEYYYPDGTYKLMTTDSGDPNDLTEWREAEPEDGEPISRSTIYQQDSRPLEETTPLFGPQEEPVLEPDYGLGAQPREGHWDPRSLQWVPDEPTSSVGKVLDDDTPWDQPREGQPTTMRSAGILDDDSEDTQVPVDEGGGAGGGVDPSVPFDPDTTPTSAEGTAAPFSVDSTSFEGSTAQGFDPSVSLGQANPYLQSGIPDPSGRPPKATTLAHQPSTRISSTRPRRGLPSITVWSSGSSRTRSWLPRSTKTRS